MGRRSSAMRAKSPLGLPTGLGRRTSRARNGSGSGRPWSLRRRKESVESAEMEELEQKEEQLLEGDDDDDDDDDDFFEEATQGEDRLTRKVWEAIRESEVVTNVRKASRKVVESDSVRKLAEKSARGRAKLSSLSSAFLESPRFRDMVDSAFDDCDIDGSGAINASELYAGVLLLYHNINRIPWGGRKPPPERELVLRTMAKYDFDGNETLDRDEFFALCQDLCSNIAADVTKRVVLVLFVFPLLALPLKRLLELVSALFSESLSALFRAIPDHMFTSAAVALLVTALPYVEANLLDASYTWEAVANFAEADLANFRRRRKQQLHRRRQ